MIGGRQSVYTGRYELQTDNSFGRPVYKSVDCGTYLHFVKGHYDFWIFGPRLSSRRGHIMAKDDEMCPSFVFSWKTYNNATQTWGDDADVKVECYTGPGKPMFNLINKKSVWSLE